MTGQNREKKSLAGVFYPKNEIFPGLDLNLSFFLLLFFSSITNSLSPNQTTKSHYKPFSSIINHQSETSSRICLRPSLSCKHPLRDVSGKGMSRSPSVHREIQFNSPTSTKFFTQTFTVLCPFHGKRDPGSLNYIRETTHLALPFWALQQLIFYSTATYCPLSVCPSPFDNFY